MRGYLGCLATLYIQLCRSLFYNATNIFWFEKLLALELICAEECDFPCGVFSEMDLRVISKQLVMDLESVM